LYFIRESIFNVIIESICEFVATEKNTVRITVKMERELGFFILSPVL
jgi:hypothetical protein